MPQAKPAAQEDAVSLGSVDDRSNRRRHCVRVAAQIRFQKLKAVLLEQIATLGTQKKADKPLRTSWVWCIS
jgi:hypothetical protein